MAKSTTEDENTSLTTPKGTLLIIGGNENKGANSAQDETNSSIFTEPEILKTFVGLINKTDAVIEVITTASSIGNEVFKNYKRVFTGLGVKHVNHIHHNTPEEVLEDDFSERVKKADAIFFSGGDQFLLTSLYQNTPFLQRLTERFMHEKIVIGGTSAGAMALATPMIYPQSDSRQPSTADVKVTTGLGLLKDICIDTHFLNRHRFVRLAKVIAANSSVIGIGVDEDTAMIIRGGQEAEVIGSGTIIFLDGCELSETNMGEEDGKKRTLIRNLKVHILSGGDRYRLHQNGL